MPVNTPLLEVGCRLVSGFGTVNTTDGPKVDIGTDFQQHGDDLGKLTISSAHMFFWSNIMDALRAAVAESSS
jgi:hypothetical protein